MGEPTKAPMAVEEVLAFYADAKNYSSPSKGFALQYDPEPAPVMVDRGARARGLLSGGSFVVRDDRKTRELIADVIRTHDGDADAVLDALREARP